jgi:phosphoribosylanthranilate isomerase
MVVCRVKDPGFAEEVNGLLNECGSEGPVAVVLDAYDTTKAGGTGEALNWDWVRAAADAGRMDDWPAIILAGGLTVENVAAGIQAVGPWAVDVSSGVESTPGRKDPAKVARFIENAKASGA